MSFAGLSTGAGIAVAGGLGLAGTVAGGLISGGSNGGAPGIEDNYMHGPSFQRGQDTQQSWFNQLQNDYKDPSGNFGAISPDWNDIWSQTQQQVRNYFEGSATNPGVNDQIKGSFAQRGMSGDPAATFMQAQSGANEAQQLGNLSAQQNIAKQTFEQQGKQNWYTAMNNFNNSTAPQQGAWTGAQPYATPGQQFGNAIGAAGSGLLSYAGQQNSANNQMNFLTGLLQNNGSNSSVDQMPNFSPLSLNGVNIQNPGDFTVFH